MAAATLATVMSNAFRTGAGVGVSTSPSRMRFGLGSSAIGVAIGSPIPKPWVLASTCVGRGRRWPRARGRSSRRTGDAGMSVIYEPLPSDDAVMVVAWLDGLTRQAGAAGGGFRGAALGGGRGALLGEAGSGATQRRRHRSALAIEQSATVVSYDIDFARFAGVWAESPRRSCLRRRRRRSPGRDT